MPIMQIRTSSINKTTIGEVPAIVSAEVTRKTSNSVSSTYVFSDKGLLSSGRFIR